LRILSFGIVIYEDFLNIKLKKPSHAK